MEVAGSGGPSPSAFPNSMEGKPTNLHPLEHGEAAPIINAGKRTMKVDTRVGWVPGLECVWRLVMLGCDSSLLGGKNATSSPSATSNRGNCFRRRKFPRDSRCRFGPCTIACLVERPLFVGRDARSCVENRYCFGFVARGGC